MDKKALRKKYKQLRLQLSSNDIDDRSLAIANKALELPIWEQTNYHIFLPIIEKREVETAYLLHVLQGRDKTVFVPKTHFETYTMQHILLQENTRIKISEYGIPEPESGIAVSASQIEVVFIPLLAFDLKGNRIGYGKGFYDRFLEQCSPNTLFVGLSFFEAENTIPVLPTDIPLHYCITPQKNYNFNRSKIL